MIRVLLMAATMMAAVSGDECTTDGITAMRSLTMCCKMESNRNSPATSQLIAGTLRNCHVMASNDSKLDSSSPTSRFDCSVECSYTKLGLMEKDKTLNKEKLQEFINELLHEDFHKSSAKAIETCAGQKYATKCPTGVDGMTLCLMAEILKDCPAPRWKGGQCNESKKFVEECGTKFYEHSTLIDDMFTVS